MKVQFDKVLVGYDGEEIKEGSGDKEKGLTLGKVCCEALMMLLQGDEGLSGEEKLNRHFLATKIHQAGADGAELKAEDVALVKKRVAQMYGPRVVGPAWLLLEGKAE